MAKIVTLQEAVSHLSNGTTVAIGGFCGFGAPDSVMREIGRSFEKNGSPRDLTIVTPACAGDGTEDGWGLSALRAEGIISNLITSVVTLPRAVQRGVMQNKIGGFFLPLGLFGHLFRAAAGREPGVLTHVGLHTFIDPRLDGGFMNEKARESGRQISRVMEIDGKEYLFYPTINMDACIIRATYADTLGNISIEKEAVHAETLELVNAVHNNKGIVIFQVEKIVEQGTLDPRMATVHKSAVDYIVRSDPGEHLQNYCVPEYRPELSGEVRIPLEDVASMEFGLRKIIARRCAMELKKGALVNLGLGVSDGVSIVASEEGISDQITLTIETGIMGGVPMTGLAMGAGINAEVLYKMPDIFDLYNGGGLDQSFLSGAQIDEEGNVNVSKFDGRIVGAGGFINISQNTQKICFSGVFTAGDVQIECENGSLRILKDGNKKKFVKKVEQVTFSGLDAKATQKDILYISERAVFRLTQEGLELIEIAPGVDLEKDVLAQMEFTPKISPNLKLMDARIFRKEPMGLTL